jgi:GNAT superfamily N-acetyltransferase
MRSDNPKNNKNVMESLKNNKNVATHQVCHPLRASVAAFKTMKSQEEIEDTTGSGLVAPSCSPFVDFQIVQTHPDLLLYVDSLQKKNAEALSFYPTQVFEREAEKGRLFLGLLNGEPCGYIYVGAKGGDVKCHQVCIQYDARRRLYGAAMVQALEDYAEGSFSITLRCGFDLEANSFWASLGYRCISVQDGGIRRMRKINVWRKQLIAELFEDIAVEPAEGKADASVWRKNKQTGLVTQFVRGKAMKDYRAKIIGENTEVRSGD